MTQPGVYFTLTAPFVKIIGLYSNATESPGLISSEQGRYAPYGVTDDQLDFLRGQLQEAKKARDDGDTRAVLVAVHHPPYSADSEHGGSPGMVADLDAAARDADFLPDAFLSGHAHIYERFTRTAGGRHIPYLVAGTGGYYNLYPLRLHQGGRRAHVPQRGRDAQGNPSDVRLENYADMRWGYLRLTVSEGLLSGEFFAVPRSGERTEPVERLDAFALDLKAHQLVPFPSEG
jgi:hypothetical protein